MMRSMFSGVSGLRVHQTKMDVIGNNIANVNTVGFKAGTVSFSEVFSQTIQNATGYNESTGMGGRNAKQIGLGVTVGAINTVMTEGAAQRTDNPLDMKIEGEGFFVVSNGNGYQFTRAGVFNLDDSGNMVTPEGYRVMGWPSDSSTGDVQKGTVQPLTVLSPANSYSEPQQTTNCYLEGNIVAVDPQLSTGGIPLNVQFYDNLGYRYTATLNVKNAASGTPGEFDVSLTDVLDSEGNSVAGGSLSSTTVAFDPATGKITNGPSFDLTGLDTTKGLPDPLNIDFSQLTMYADKTNTSNIQSQRGDLDKKGAGREAGSIIGFGVGGDGKIVGNYSNGETKILGQIVTTTFDNPAGLEKKGNNLFTATMNSGEFDGIGQDPTASGGGLNSGVLEMSNVDLSKEFTEMITTQRGFQANSRIITSSDEMLQELVNLKR